jgi:hypothetical protein
MYNSSGATIRQDVNILVSEAASADSLFIGSRVLPPLSVDAKSGTYPKLAIGGGELLSNIATERSRGSSYGKVVRAWTSDSYDCVDRGLEEAVDDTDQKDLARFFNLEATAAKLCVRNMLLAYEVRVVAAVMNTTNFGSATNSVVAYTAANLATINFASDVVAAIRRVNNNGARANTIVIPGVVFDRLVLSTLLQNWVRGNASGALNAPMNAANIAASFRDYGIEQVLIGSATNNTAKKGAAASMAAIWPVTNIWVGQVNASAMSPQDGGAGFTFYWNKEGGLYVTESYRDESSRSNIVRVRQNTAEKIVDGTAGTLIATQYS